MSRKFEEEYKEYLNAQAPDLWSRIETGIAESGLQDEKIVPLNKTSKKHDRKKKQIRRQNYRMIVSAAACLFALVLVLPVYMLVKPTGKDATQAELAPIVLTDATIQNIEVETTEAAEEQEEVSAAEEMQEAPMMSEAETEEETMPEQEVLMMEQVIGELPDKEISETNETEALGAPEDGGSDITETDLLPATDDTTGSTGATQKESEGGAVTQEEMTVVILSEGVSCENGTCYTAALAGSTDSRTMELFVASDCNITFEKDKVYTITVERMTDGNFKVIVCFA